MLWLRRLIVAGAMLTPLSVTAQTPESRVAESWEQAVIYLPGELRPTPRGEIKIDKPAPVAIFMHGCGGIGSEDHAWARLLAEERLLVVLPDSLARTARQPSCNPAKLQTGLFPRAPAMRLEEIRYASDQIRKESWFDGKNLFLMGFSEGATAVVRTNLTRFRGVIATSTTCTNAKFPSFDGVFLPIETPVLTLSHERDPWVSDVTRGSCAQKISARPDAQHVTVPGKGHGTFHSDQAKEAVVQFIRRILQSP